MAKIFKYAFFTSTAACFFVAVPSLIIPLFLGSGGELMISTILRLHVIYVFLVPWLCSTLCLVLALLIFGRKGGAKRRWLLGGLSVGVGYSVIFLWDVIESMSSGRWGRISTVGAIWLLAGFGAGYLAAFVVDKIMKPEFNV